MHHFCPIGIYFLEYRLWCIYLSGETRNPFVPILVPASAMWSAMVNAGMRNPLQAGEGDSCWYVDHIGSLCSRKNWGVCLCGMMLMMHVMNNDEYDMSSPQMPIVPRLQRHQRRHPTLCQSIVIHHQLKLWSSTGIDLRWARWCFCSFYWISMK